MGYKQADVLVPTHYSFPKTIPRNQNLPVNSPAMSSSDADAAAFNAYALLAETTVRLFYGLPEVFVMKALLSAPKRTTIDGTVRPELQLDEQIAERVRLDKAYTRKLLARLAADRLVRSEKPRAKEREGEERVSVANQSAYTSEQVSVYWGLDFEVMADAVAYKLDAMERRLADRAKGGLQGYSCPKCKLEVAAVEIQHAIDPMTGTLLCPECFGVEMVEADDSQSAALVEAHKAALQLHTAGLHRTLQDVADLPAPTYCWPKPDANEGAAGGAAAGAGGAGGGGGGGGAGGARGGFGGGDGGGNTLGASKGIARAVGSGSALLAPVPWMQSAADIAAAESSASAAAEQSRAAAGESAEDAQSAQWEREYLQRYEESRRAGMQQPVAAAPAAAKTAPPMPPASSASSTVDAMDVVQESAPPRRTRHRMRRTYVAEEDEDEEEEKSTR